jgi:hypothetical protein
LRYADSVVARSRSMKRVDSQDDDTCLMNRKRGIDDRNHAACNVIGHHRPESAGKCHENEEIRECKATDRKNGDLR